MKTKNKSIRMTQELYEYISTYPEGESFNNKLENAVVCSRLKEDVLKAIIAKKEEELKKINSLINDKKQTLIKLNKIENCLNLIINEI